MFDPDACDARSVHVTDPPDAVGVTVVVLEAFSTDALTVMRSPACTSNGVDVFEAPVPQFVDGAAEVTRVGGVATGHPFRVVVGVRRRWG